MKGEDVEIGRASASPFREQQLARNVDADATARLLHGVYSGRLYRDWYSRQSHEKLRDLLELVDGEASKIRAALQSCSSPGAHATSNISPARIQGMIDQNIWKAVGGERPQYQLLEEILDAESQTVYSAPVLRPSACRELCAEIDEFSAECMAPGTATSMHRRSMIVRPESAPPVLCALCDTLLEHVAKPLAETLFTDFEGMTSLSSYHAFVVEYDARSTGSLTVDEEKQLSLMEHTDDSEFTLNISLGEDFEGGELLMRGVRGRPDLDDEDGGGETIIPHVIGRAVMHTGTQFHAARRTSCGRRRNLIMWIRSDLKRSRTCPCCLLQNRSYRECVCG